MPDTTEQLNLAPVPTIDGQKRFHILHQIDIWEANDIEIAKQQAEVLIKLLKSQFDIE